MDLWRNPVVRFVPSFGRDKPVVHSVLFDKIPDPVPTGYHLVEGVGCYKLHTESRLLTDAAIVCQSEGVNTHLAVFKKATDYDTVYTYLETLLKPQPLGVYVGYMDKPDEGIFLTITGQPTCMLDPMMFNPGQPDNARAGEDCAVIGFEGTSHLNDFNCPLPRPFLCEQTLSTRSAPCLP